MFRKLVRTAPMVALVLAMLVPASGLLAQTTGGNLEGRVTQDTNALPGVTVTATNIATGVTRTTITGADGDYRFAVLPAGTYKVTFSLSGFSDVTIEEAVVNVGSTTVVDASMKVAAVEETITVTAEAPLIATEPAIGTVVSQNELENLPLNGRQFANVAVLAPGTSLVVQLRPHQAGPAHRAAQRRQRPQRQLHGRRRRQHRRHHRRRAAELQPRRACRSSRSRPASTRPSTAARAAASCRWSPRPAPTSSPAASTTTSATTSVNAKTETEKRAGAEQARSTAATSTAPPSAARSCATRPTSSPPTRSRGATQSTPSPPAASSPSSTARRRRLRSRTSWSPPRRPSTSSPAQLPAGALRLPEEHRQVRRQPDRHAGQPGHASPTSTSRSSSATPRMIGADCAQRVPVPVHRLRATSSRADSNNPTLYFPSGVRSGQNVNTPQTTIQTKYQYKDDFTYSHRPRRAIGTTSRSASTTSTSPISAATSPPGSRAASTCSTNDPNGPVGEITRSRRLRRLLARRSSSTRLRPGRLVHHRPPDAQPRPPLRLLGGLRSRPAHAIRSGRRCRTQTQFTEYYLRDFQGGGGGVLENDDNNFAPRLGFTYDIKGDGATHPARRLRHLLRLPVHQRHHSVPVARPCSRTTA